MRKYLLMPIIRLDEFCTPDIGSVREFLQEMEMKHHE
jgi:hypothetical protein